MSSKRCPNCSKIATTFTVFFTSFTTIQCQHCDTKLRFGMGVAFLLVAMVIIGLAVPIVLVSVNTEYDLFSWEWTNIAFVAGYTIFWYSVTSFLAWKVVEFELPGNNKS